MTWRFEIYETLASTSDFCRCRAESGEAAGLAVLAREQSAGRGSRGRSWSSGKGNLAFSFLISLPEETTFFQVLPFMAALALYETSSEFIIADSGKVYDGFLCLKWPNDLLLDGRKMAGILIETGENKGNRWAVIGVGVNIMQAPVIKGCELSALSEVIDPPDIVTYAKALLAAFDYWRQYRQHHGDQALYCAWLERAHPVGTRLAVRGHETYITGRFNGLDGQGCLLLECDNGDVLPVVTGDILCV